MSRKATGKPIKFGHAEALRKKAIDFAADPAIAVTLGGLIPSAEEETRSFYNNLDCGFVFDKDSLLSLMAKIIAIPDSGLIMMMGASDDTDTERKNKPTLSIFACTISRSDIPGVDDTYSIIHPDSAHPEETDGVEHPGLVDLSKGKGGDISNGTIKFLNL
ncbi:hypothetical protein [Ferruginibacter sp.]|nr:hypothetical protein [Ferruginibacter sp.]